MRCCRKRSCRRREEQHSSQQQQRRSGIDANDDVSCPFLYILMNEVVQHVLKFLPSKDRVAVLTLTCTRLRDEVETLYQKGLQTIRKNHHVSDNEQFEAAIRNQSSIVTTRTKPVHLQWRYLFAKATKTPLYTIPLSKGYSSPCFAVSASGDRLVVAGRFGSRARLWNLPSKTTPQPQEINTGLDEDDGLTESVFFANEDRIVRLSHIAQVYSLTDGAVNGEIELLHEYKVPPFHCELFQNEHTLIFAEYEDISVHALDVGNPFARPILLGTIGDVGPDYSPQSLKQMLVCNQRWLIAHVHRGHQLRDQISVAYVLDLQHDDDSVSSSAFTELAGFHRHYASLWSSPDSNTIYAMHDSHGNMDIWELDAVVDGGRPIGVNYRIQNCKQPYFHALENHGYRDILAVSKSHVFACNRLRYVMVFNDVGEMVRILTDTPDRTTEKAFVSETQNELFLAVNKFNYPGKPAFQGKEITAYCLSEPM